MGDDNFEKYHPYLMEIKKRLLFVVSLFLVASIFGFIYYEKLIRIVLKIFNFEGVNIVFTSPFQFINLAINSAMIVGVLAVLPLFIYQLLSFLKPALDKREYRLTAFLFPVVIVLFAIGFAFGLFMMRYVVFLFLQRSVDFDIGNFLDISALLSQTLTTSLFMGLAFQFPVVLTVLLRFQVIGYKALVKQRIIAYSASIFFAALLPPTDLISLILLTLPLVILFELTLILNKVVLKSHLLKKGR